MSRILVIDADAAIRVLYSPDLTRGSALEAQLTDPAYNRFCMVLYSNVGVHRFTSKAYTWEP